MSSRHVPILQVRGTVDLSKALSGISCDIRVTEGDGVAVTREEVR